MKSIAIVELIQGGHHDSYVHLYSRLFLEAGCKVTAFFPEPGGIQHWVRKFCGEFSSEFGAAQIRRPADAMVNIRLVSPLLATMRRWEIISQTLSRHADEKGIEFDFVFFNFLDNLLLPFPLSKIALAHFPWEWGGIFLQPAHLYRWKPSQKPVRRRMDLFDVFRTPRCRLVGSLEEDIIDDLGLRISQDRLRVFPDVIDTMLPRKESVLARSIKERAQGRKVIAYFGKFRREKSPVSFMDLALSEGMDQFCFLLFGAIAEEKFTPGELSRIRSFITSPPAHCFVHLEAREQNEEQYNELIKLCDIVFAVYRDYPHSSNTITKAAYFRKLLVVSKGYCIAERVKKYRMGIAVDQNDTGACRAALEEIANKYDALVDRADFSGYFCEHSAEKALSIIKDVGIL